jgi:hypothetical protein
MGKVCGRWVKNFHLADTTPAREEKLQFFLIWIILMLLLIINPIIAFKNF